MIKLYYSFLEKAPEDYSYPGYTYGWVTPAELRQVEKLHKNFGFWPLIHLMFCKERAYAIKDNGKIVSFLLIGVNEIKHLGTKVKLKRNEAHLYFTWTLKEHRGNGLAEALRHKVYSLLKDEGRYTFYSFTDYGNKSALRFKEKIKAKKLALYLYIKIGKFEKRIKIKSYEKNKN